MEPTRCALQIRTSGTQRQPSPTTTGAGIPGFSHTDGRTRPHGLPRFVTLSALPRHDAADSCRPKSRHVAPWPQVKHPLQRHNEVIEGMAHRHAPADRTGRDGTRAVSVVRGMLGR